MRPEPQKDRLSPGMLSEAFSNKYFSSTSLDRNRELGLITASPAILAAVAGAFTGDFRHGTHWPRTRSH